jgi:hypothetical protein
MTKKLMLMMTQRKVKMTPIQMKMKIKMKTKTKMMMKKLMLMIQLVMKIHQILQMKLLLFNWMNWLNADMDQKNLVEEMEKDIEADKTNLKQERTVLHGIEV